MEIMESNSILSGVVGYVEVRSSYDNRSAAIAKEMEQLGARVVKTFTDEVTHVVFKEGLKRTWNKSMKRGIPMVSVSWLDSCKQHRKRVPEKDFPALIPEDNSGSPLLCFNPAPRWKKFKSMQPCDFEEDLAKSSERLEKRLKRKRKANRFNPQEEATPTNSSHLRILALDTQARTPHLQNLWDSASPRSIPETPQSMRVRLERMRQEQREVLSSSDSESPTGTPKQLLAQKPHPKHLLEKLVSCTSSENSNDDAMSRVVTSIIQNLDSNNSSQSPVCKTMPQKNIPSGLVTHLSMDSLAQLVGTSTQEGELICDENFSPGINREICVRRSGSSDSHCRSSAKPLSPQDLNSGKPSFSSTTASGFSKTCHGESLHCLGLNCNEEKPKLYSPRETTNFTHNPLTDTKIQDLDFCLTECNENVKTHNVCKPVDPELVGLSCDRAESTDDEPKAKPAKKRNLLAGKQFYSLQSPSPVDGLNNSLEAPSSSSGLRETHSLTDVSFLFGISESKTGPQLQPARGRRRSELLKSTEAEASKVKKTRRKSVCQNSSSGSSRLYGNQSKDSSKDLSANTTLDESTEKNLLLSVTSTKRTATANSRLSMDDFNLKKKISVAVKRRRKESPNATVKQISETTTLSSNVTNNDARVKKANETSGKKVNKKSFSKRSATVPQPSQKCPVKRKRVQSSDSAEDAETSLNRSSSAHKAEGTRVSLRHARSLLLEQPHKLINKKLPYSLVVTSLHKEEQELTYSVLKKLGIFQLTNTVDCTTSHVVCGGPRRTLNLVKAVARGCWILEKKWVLDSLEAGEWLEEDKYEMDADFPAAKKSRLERQKAGDNYKMDLFSKKGLIYVSDDCTPERKDVVHLINLCCGHVSGSKVRASLHIGNNYDPEKIMIHPSWVLDCIMKMETLDVNKEQYIVPPPMSSSQRERSPEF